MRFSKRWTGDNRTRKSGSGPQQVTSSSDERHLLSMVMMDSTAFIILESLLHIGPQLQVYHYMIRQFVNRCCCTVDCVLELIYTESPSRKIINAMQLQFPHENRDWRSNWQVFLFFLTPTLICGGTIMAVSVLDAMLGERIIGFNNGGTHYWTSEWPYARCYGLGCDCVLWTIAAAMNWG